MIMLKNVIEIAINAGKILMKFRKEGFQTTTKTDSFDFLTTADIKSEEFILSKLKEEFSEDFILSEEKGEISGKNVKRVWMIDPLDGTKDFKNGGTGFSVMIGLCEDGKPILGVIYDPIVDRLVYAEKGKGATLNGKPIKVSTHSSYSEKTIVDGSFYILGFDNLIKTRDIKIVTTRVLSCVYGGMLVALGEFIAEIYRYINPWDAAAVKIVVEEAGGKVTDLLGLEQRYDQEINGFIASNGRVHDELVRRAKNYFKKK